MKKGAALIFRSILLLVVAVGFAVAHRPVAARADGNEIPHPQEAARESIASRDNTTYKVPHIPEGTEGDAHFALPPNSDGPVLADMGLYIEEIPAIN